jgi:hypothetical protein
VQCDAEDAVVVVIVVYSLPGKQSVERIDGDKSRKKVR